MRVVLLRPPRYVWPFNSETSAFWQPLGLLCLAAYARQHRPGLTIEVWDCPAQAMGWKSLRRRLQERPIDVLGLGEETVSAGEAMRAARLVRQLHPQCLIVAGGPYFSFVADDILPAREIDVIVRGEGEATFAELLAHAPRRDSWNAIPGLSFLDSAGHVAHTPDRPLLTDLDRLPMPAYDLLDMSLYGRNSHNHPRLVSIEHSRGCVDSCHFCVLWRQMGQPSPAGPIAPCYRTKSPARSFEEVRQLHERFGRRTFGWVDPTFNASPQWSDAWAEMMLASPLASSARQPRTIHTAWMRADGVVRDEKLGVLDKLVRAGLRQVMIGIERDDACGLQTVGKHHNGLDTCRQALDILRRRYPQVYTIGTMIFGLPDDGPEDLARLAARQYELDVDYCFLMPFTPHPGTELSRLAHEQGLVENTDLRSYNFHTPVCRTRRLSLRDLESLYWKLMLRMDRRRLARGLWQLFQPDPRRRRVHRALLAKGTQIALQSLARRIFRPASPQPALYSRRPSWYED